MRSAFVLGWLAGAATALSGSALWLALVFGVGVSAGEYDWPFLLFRTSLPVASDLLMTVFLTGALLLEYLYVRGRSARA